MITRGDPHGNTESHHVRSAEGLSIDADNVHFVVRATSATNRRVEVGSIERVCAVASRRMGSVDKHVLPCTDLPSTQQRDRRAVAAENARTNYLTRIRMGIAEQRVAPHRYRLRQC